MKGTPNHSDFPASGWERLKELYSQATALESPERDLLFDRAGAGSETRDEILRLLGYREQAAEYFSQLSNDIRSLADAEPLIECGTKLGGRFLVTRFLARGGMGEVYEAEDLELGGQLALKVMRPGVIERVGSLQRFRDEIRLGRRVNSPHVCRVYDVARHIDAGREFVFFTMELLDGETISDRLVREGPIPVAAAREVIRQIAIGLDAAHQAGVLHRDLKSNNIMLCRSGGGIRVAITDFGLSRHIGSAEESDTLDGATPAYIAPEQLERQEETEGTDIYSLGVVLFEMMTGGLPFRGDSPLETARMRLTEKPPSPRRARPDLPRAWESSILRCLEVDPSRRFGSAREVARGFGVLEEERQPSRRSLLALGQPPPASRPS